MSFQDKTALVTGAASGIGRAIAVALGDGRVGGLVLVDRDAQGLAETAAAVGPARSLVSPMDVADPLAWTQAQADIRARFGALDIVAAAAGLTENGRIADMPFTAWRKVLAANLDGVFLTLQTGFRLIRDGGAMVTISSAAALKAEIGVGAYGASKAAVVQLTKVAAKEGAARGVRINALLPGGVETPIWRQTAFFQELVAETGSERAAFDTLATMGTPLARYAKPEETARQALFLLSDQCGPITGAALVADGGYTL